MYEPSVVRLTRYEIAVELVTILLNPVNKTTLQVLTFIVVQKMLLLCEEAGLELEEDVLLHVYLFLVAKAQIEALILDYAAISGIDMLDITLIL